MYQTERHQQFCLVHFLSSEQYWVTEPVISLPSHTDKQVAPDKSIQSPTEEGGTNEDDEDDPTSQEKEFDLRKCDHNKEDVDGGKSREKNVVESEDNEEAGGMERSAVERRGKHPGRPRYRGLDVRGISRAEDEEGRRKDYEEGTGNLSFFRSSF